MDNQWSLDTRGDPLGKLQDFIKHTWQTYSLDGMLVTLYEGAESRATPHYITDPAAIEQVNPFRPLMQVNAARLVPALLARHPAAKVGALLRPCELRALTEIAKHTSLNLDQLLTISVDCLGTLPANEYQWRLERFEANPPAAKTTTVSISDELAQEAIKFARQGGIIPYRYRSACQMCASPAAQYADINLHVLGLPVRQHILVSLRTSQLADTIHINDYANGIADQSLIHQHEHTLSKMSERHTRLMERLNQSLGSLLPADVDAVIQQLENCGVCQSCLQVCPICSVDPPRRDVNGHYDRQSVMRWLVSCAGCGMCEQSCPNHLPTSAIFGHIRQQLDRQFKYVPGISSNDPLPLI